MSSTSGQANAAPFRLTDFAPELQECVLDFVVNLPRADISAACRVCKHWNTRFTPLLYHSLSVTKDNRESVLFGLGLDYLSASALESRASEDGGGAAIYGPPTPPHKVVSLAHVRSLAMADSSSATSIAEAMIVHEGIFSKVDEVVIGPSLFRYLVTTIAAFGRPRTGAAFIGETIIAQLRPRHLHITFPPSKSRALIFDPIVLARVMAALLIDWKPETLDYHGIGSDFPPVLGPHSRIHCIPCVFGDDDWGDGADDPLAGIKACRAHGSIIRMHLRRTFGPHAKEDLLEAIAEAADPTDEADLDPSEIPDPAKAYIEYHGVPCIAAADRELFLAKTFARWPTEVDVGSQVSFFA